MTTEPIYIDNSMLSTVAECSTEAVLRHVLQYDSREETAHLKAGSAIHEALRVWFEGGSLVDALQKFSEDYEEWASENNPEERLSHSNVKIILQNWLETHPVNSFPFRPVKELVEVGFSYPLDDYGEFVLVGRIDLGVYDLREDAMFVVDHKTTGSINQYWAKQFRLASGLSGYMWALQQYLTQGNVVGAYINAIQLSKLPSDPTRKCKDHAVPYVECGPLHAKAELLGPFYRTPAQIAEWRRTAIFLAKKYKALLEMYGDPSKLSKVRMQGMFNGACRFCAFYDFCQQARDVKFIDSLLVKNKWEPFEGARTGDLGFGVHTINQ